VVRVDGELGPKGRDRGREVVPLLVHEALAVEGVDERHLRVPLEGPPDLRQRLLAFAVPHVHHREEDVRLRGVVAQDPVDGGLRLGRAALGEERHPQQVRHCAVRGAGPGERLQDLDDTRVLAEPEAAVGEEERRRLVARLRGEHLLGLARRLRQAAGLVEREGQVPADRDVGTVRGERPLVLDHGLLVAAEARVGRAQVRAEDGAVRPHPEHLLVESHCALDVSALL
jgi:hypothetical protein